MHDQNFKNLILDYPVQALQFFAAEEAPDDLPQARIIPFRQEQLKERLGDRFYELASHLARLMRFTCSPQISAFHRNESYQS